VGKSQLVSEFVKGKGHAWLENIQSIRRRARYIKIAVTPDLGTESKQKVTQSNQNPVTAEQLSRAHSLSIPACFSVY